MGLLLPVARLLAFDPAGILDDRVSGRGDFRGALRSIEALDRLDRIAVLPDAQAMADDLIEINEHLVPEQLIHLVLAGVMARAQPPHRADLVGGVMVDVHAGIALPAREDPVHEALEGALLLLTVVRPPVPELPGSRRAGSRTDPEQVFQSAGHQRIALHVEKDIGWMVRRKRGQAHRFAVRSRLGQQFVARRGIGIVAAGPRASGIEDALARRVFPTSFGRVSER